MSQVSWEETGRAQDGYVRHNIPTRYSGSVYSRVWSWSPVASLSGASGSGNRRSFGNRWSGQQERLHAGPHYQAHTPPLWNFGGWPKSDQPRLHRVSTRSVSSSDDNESSFASSATLKPATWFAVIVGILSVLGISIGLVVYFTGGAGSYTAQGNVGEGTLTTISPITTPLPPDETTTPEPEITTEALVLPESSDVNVSMSFSASNLTSFLGNSTLEEKMEQMENELIVTLQNETGFDGVTVTDIYEEEQEEEVSNRRKKRALIIVIIVEYKITINIMLLLNGEVSTKVSLGIKVSTFVYNTATRMVTYTTGDGSGGQVGPTSAQYVIPVIVLTSITVETIITQQEVITGGPCATLFAANPVACGINGNCTVVTDTYVETAECHCRDGWTGDACDVEITPCTLYTDCEPNGDCVVDYTATDDVTCSCSAGWEGALCDSDIYDVKGTANDATVAPPVRRRRSVDNADGRKGDLGFDLPYGLVYINDVTLYAEPITEGATDEYLPWNVGFKGRIFDKKSHMQKPQQLHWNSKGYNANMKDFVDEPIDDTDDNDVQYKGRMKGEKMKGGRKGEYAESQLFVTSNEQTLQHVERFDERTYTHDNNKKRRQRITETWDKGRQYTHVNQQTLQNGSKVVDEF